MTLKIVAKLWMKHSKHLDKSWIQQKNFPLKVSVRVLKTHRKRFWQRSKTCEHGDNISGLYQILQNSAGLKSQAQ